MTVVWYSIVIYMYITYCSTQAHTHANINDMDSVVLNFLMLLLRLCTILWL